MLNKSIARRYAEAFFAIAQENNKIDAFQEELSLVVRTIADNPDLKTFMLHLLVPPAEKKSIASKLFTGKISDITMNFINLVIDKRRTAYFEAILQEYIVMADESRNILKAELVSAKPVTNDDVAEIEKAFSSVTGKTVKLNLTVDPSLIGGVKVRVGDRVIDASVKKKLQLMETSLKQAKIS